VGFVELVLPSALLFCWVRVGTQILVFFVILLEVLRFMFVVVVFWSVVFFLFVFFVFLCFL